MPYHSTGSVCRLLCAKDKHSLHRFSIRMGSQNSQNGLPKCVFSVSWQTGHEHACCYEESGAFPFVCNAFQQAFSRHNNASWKSAYLGATLLRHSITISPIRPFLLVFNCSLSMAAVERLSAHLTGSRNPTMNCNCVCALGRRSLFRCPSPNSIWMEEKSTTSPCDIISTFSFIWILYYASSLAFLCYEK